MMGSASSADIRAHAREGSFVRKEVHEGRGGFLETALSQPPEDYFGFVDDDRLWPIALSHQGQYRIGAIAQTSRWQTLSCNVADGQLSGGLALTRQAGAQPIQFSGLVVIDLPEAKRCEPRRGPRAYVSGELVAVDDDRPLAIKGDRSPAGELLDRNVDRPGDMQPGVVAWREHLDQLSSLPKQLLHLRPFDTPNH